MKKVLGFSTIALVAAGTAMANDSFYGGDFDNRNGGASQVNGSLDSAIYDDFTISKPTQINLVFGNWLMNNNGNEAVMNTLWWEIRQGVSAGNGGTVIVAGHHSNVTSQTLTGRTGFSRREFNIAADVKNENIILMPGTYHLAVALGNSATTGQLGFLSTTSGANGIGGPLANGNSFWNGTSFGHNWTPSDAVFGAGIWDFSMGFVGKDIPAPGALALLGAAGLVARRRRRA